MTFTVKTIYSMMTFQAESYEKAFESMRKQGYFDDEIESIRLSNEDLRYLRKIRNGLHGNIQ